MNFLAFVQNADTNKYIEKTFIKTINGIAPNPETGDVTLEVSGGNMPEVTTEDNGKFLRVINGMWAASSVPNAEEANF